ncbi:uncharacterized protein KY384_000399 [Bacidia gigantensis]|uniref:uncharacterized protein n=1 Tax=Bacidia gigantensis TaxID=2732470 RepID=UPI001D040847|nr:uncharacterized protein KY384_000399 [Bacidia gigantensis]KAG8525639.1 hypothetical protein KY384_000399 [Bacidia gigantensis]
MVLTTTIDATTTFPIPGSNPPLKLQITVAIKSGMTGEQARRVLANAITEIQGYIPFESGDPVPECGKNFVIDGTYALHLAQVPGSFKAAFTWLVALQAVQGYQTYVGQKDPVLFGTVRILADGPEELFYGIMLLGKGR